MIWKYLYGQTSRDHGSLGYFKSLLNRAPVKKDPKKAVDPCLDFLLTTVKGHLLGAACDYLGVPTLDSPIQLPPGIHKRSTTQQYTYLESVAKHVVENFTLVGSAFTGETVRETGDGVHNYARVLCHYGSLVMEFLDGWREGDGERVYRCWKLFLPHFLAANRRKYALEALRLQMQVQAVTSPHLAHHILWDRFVNTRGGIGRNIPCDLHNEHVNKLVKQIITNMGANLTDEALQRAARSVSTLESLCERFDRSSRVPVITHSHSTRTDAQDVGKVVHAVLSKQLLSIVQGRKHSSYPKISSNPLKNWDLSKARQWIEGKKIEFRKYRGLLHDEEESSESETDD